MRQGLVFLRGCFRWWQKCHCPSCPHGARWNTPVSCEPESAGAGDFAFCFFFSALPFRCACRAGTKREGYLGVAAPCALCHGVRLHFSGGVHFVWALPSLPPSWGSGKRIGNLVPVTVFVPDGHGDWHSGS